MAFFPEYSTNTATIEVRLSRSYTKELADGNHEGRTVIKRYSLKDNYSLDRNAVTEISLAPEYIQSMSHTLNANGTANELSLTLYQHLDASYQQTVVNQNKFMHNRNSSLKGINPNTPHYLMQMLALGYGDIEFRYGYVQSNKESTLDTMTDWFKMQVVNVTANFTTNGVTYNIDAVSTIVGQSSTDDADVNWNEEYKNYFSRVLFTQKAMDNGEGCSIRNIVEYIFREECRCDHVYWLNKAYEEVTDQFGHHLKYISREDGSKIERLYIPDDSLLIKPKTDDERNNNTGEDDSTTAIYIQTHQPFVTYALELLQNYATCAYGGGKVTYKTTETDSEGNEQEKTIENCTRQYYAYTVSYGDFDGDRVVYIYPTQIAYLDENHVQVGNDYAQIDKSFYGDFLYNHPAAFMSDTALGYTGKDFMNNRTNSAKRLLVNSYGSTIEETMDSSGRRLTNTKILHSSQAIDGGNPIFEVISMNLSYPIIAGLQYAQNFLNTSSQAVDKDGNVIQVSGEALYDSRQVSQGTWQAISKNYATIAGQLFVEGTITVPGLIRTIPLLSKLRVFIYISGVLDVQSGYFQVLKQVDTIQSGKFTTDVSVFKVTDLDGNLIFSDSGVTPVGNPDTSTGTDGSSVNTSNDVYFSTDLNIFRKNDGNYATLQQVTSGGGVKLLTMANGSSIMTNSADYDLNYNAVKYKEFLSKCNPTASILLSSPARAESIKLNNTVAAKTLPMSTNNIDFLCKESCVSIDTSKFASFSTVYAFSTNQSTMAYILIDGITNVNNFLSEIQGLMRSKSINKVVMVGNFNTYYSILSQLPLVKSGDFKVVISGNYNLAKNSNDITTTKYVPSYNVIVSNTVNVLATGIINTGGVCASSDTAIVAFK